MKGRVAVIGGGITGLSCAFYLSRLGLDDIVLFEKEGRVGGKIETCYPQGMVVELGPDSLFTRKQAILDLIDDLQLRGEVIEPRVQEFSMLLGGRLQKVPRGLLKFGGIDPLALAGAPFLSDESKADVLAEEHVPPASGEDESIASFFRRRYGQEFSKMIAEPLLAGTHGGSPDRLSMQALYPGYLTLEKCHGSLAAGVRKTSAPSTDLSTFISFKRGIGTLTDALSEAISGVDVRLRKTPKVARDGDRILVDGQRCDALLVAVSPTASADLLARIVPGIEGELMSITSRSAAIVTLAYRSSSVVERLYGTGFLVPEDEPAEIAGATWSSAKWQGRAPADTALIRVFLGDEAADKTPETLEHIGVREMSRILEMTDRPDFSHTQFWRNGLPQYGLGHLDTVERIEELTAELPGLYLAGQPFRGAGVGDCVRQGKEAAVKISEMMRS